MKKVVVVVVILVIAGAVALRLQQEFSSEPVVARAGNPNALVPTMLVGVAAVEEREFSADLEVLGELEARARVEVMSRISGRLEKVLVERGDRVEEGRLLVKVDDADIQQQLRRAEASIAVARAGVAREKATAENLLLQVERYQGLHAEALISTQDLEDLESRLRAAQAQVQVAEAQVQQAEASLRELKIQHEQTQIYAPLTGFVATRHLDPGALVNPSTPILSVLDLSRVKMIVPIQEATLSRVSVGLRARVVLDAYPGRQFTGTVTRISPYLDRETRSADVEIEMNNSAGLLRPGMFARVQIDAPVLSRGLAIPRSALLTRGDQKGVYQLTAELQTVFYPVQIGQIDGGWVEVVEGLEAGARVVTTGAQKLNEGDKVRIK